MKIVILWISGEPHFNSQVATVKPLYSAMDQLNLIQSTDYFVLWRLTQAQVGINLCSDVPFQMLFAKYQFLSQLRL